MSGGPPPARKRRPHRREQLLAAAAELFRERGYEATGIDDIGAAVGISGPGVYRHFQNKLDILETLLREQGAHGLAQVQAILADADSPPAALDALVAHYADTMAANPGMAVVAMYERRLLSPDTRRLVDRWEHENTEAWVGAVATVRPELAEPEARALVHAALRAGVAVCNYDSGLDPDAVSALVASMVREILDGRSSPVTARSRAARASPRP